MGENPGDDGVGPESWQDMVQGLGFRVYSLGCRVKGVGFRV